MNANDSTRCSRSGFTLVETLIAMGFLGLGIVGIYTALARLNDMANSSRIYSSAFQIVQARADRALSVRPFTPLNGADPFITSGTNPIASSLMLCGTSTVVLGVPCVETVNILIDPDALRVSGVISPVVTGTLTTIIQNASLTTGAPPSISGTVQLRSINFNLNYTYRGRPFNIQMSCLRSPDV